MKKSFLNLVIIVATILSALTSCEKESNGKEKLLETIVIGSKFYTKFKYDDKNRILTMSTYNEENDLLVLETFTYSGSDLVKTVSESFINPEDILTITWEFTKTENIISAIQVSNLFVLSSTVTLELNGDELPVSSLTETSSGSFAETYQIKNGNLVKVSRIEKFGEEISEKITEYKYGKNKSPYYSCQTPKWYLFWQAGMGSKNNVTEIQTSDNSSVKYEYVFDSDGYPKRYKEKSSVVGFTTTTTFELKYKDLLSDSVSD